MAEFDNLRHAGGGRLWGVAKEIKDFLNISWRAPLALIYGGPLLVLSDEDDIEEPYELLANLKSSMLYQTSTGLVSVVPI